MKRSTAALATFFAMAALGVTSFAAGCGSETDEGGDGGYPFDPSNPLGFGDAGNTNGDAKPCTGLCLQQKQCTGGTTTTLSGTVKDPAGKVPLYNVLVYVPNAPVQPITTGASCDRCGSVSGDPLVTALTDAKGQFKLENVPVGKDIPLVVQIGKWRRQITIPNVPECTDTPLADDQIRMPRNKAEGDLPQMAIATGQADPFECLLTKMGIDLAEFTRDTADGRVHFFRENGVDTQPASPAANTLYNDLGKMKKYDIIFLPCEGDERDKPATADKNLVDYTSAGGRVFTTHYGYAWLAPNLGADPFPTTGKWQPEQTNIGDNNLLTAVVNQGFPKGKAFAEWLVNVNASKVPGEIELIESRHDLNEGNDPPSTTWMTTSEFPGPNNKATMHITFNTPIGVPDEQQCGRVVFSDFHVSATAQNKGQPFPASCKSGDLSDQEKALEFMLFDLSSCIQSDKAAPTPPAVVK